MILPIRRVRWAACAGLILACLGGCAGLSSTEPATSRSQSTVNGSTNTNELYGKTWLLEGPGTVLLDKQARPDLLINENGRLNASTGCNTFFGNVTVDNQGAFAADLGGMSMMACPPPLDQQEDAFMRALKQSSRFELQNEQLYLLDSQGTTTLRFSPAR